MNRLTVWAMGCGVACIIITALFYALAPTSDQLRQEAIDQAHATSSGVLDKQLVQDLNASDQAVSTTHRGFNTADVTASLYAKWGDFYQFSLVANQGGGFTVDAFLNPNGHFSILWQGQDILPCEPYVEGYHIPREIEPYCMKNVVIDRSNTIRSIYTSLFNPYINSKGETQF